MPSSRDLPDQGTELNSLMSPALKADSLLSEPPWKPKDVLNAINVCFQMVNFMLCAFYFSKKKKRKKPNSNDYIYFTFSTL